VTSLSVGTATKLRPATLADVVAMEVLMAPFVASGDLLPRSNYGLRRQTQESVVAATRVGSLVGTERLKV